MWGLHFLPSKCPECGTLDVEVEFFYAGHAFKYRNDTKDEITIEHIGGLNDCFIEFEILWPDEDEPEDSIGIRCNQCGCEFNSMITVDKISYPSITKLLYAIAKDIDSFDNSPSYLTLKIGDRIEKDDKHIIIVETTAIYLTEARRDKHK